MFKSVRLVISYNMGSIALSDIADDEWEYDFEYVVSFSLVGISPF